MEAAKNDIIGEILDEKEYPLPHNIIPSKALHTKEQRTTITHDLAGRHLTTPESLHYSEDTNCFRYCWAHYD